MTKDEALRLALEALEYTGLKWPQVEEAITAIEAALEAKDEPMEFFDWYDNAHWGNEDFKEGCHRSWNAAIKYTAKTNQEAKDEPPRFPTMLRKMWSGTEVQEWVNENWQAPPQRKPLTDDEITLIIAARASSHQHTDIHLARAIEQAHGITG